MDPNPVRYLKTKNVLDIVPYSLSHIWRLERQGLFPKRVHLGANRIAWVATEIEDWLSSKLAERGGQ